MKIVIYYKALCGILIIAGTYILSKNIFEQSIKKQVNFEFKNLPWYIQIIIIIFGNKQKYDNKELWEVDAFPTPENFPWKKRVKILEPFVGFILIVLGTIFALFS